MLVMKGDLPLRIQALQLQLVASKPFPPYPYTLLSFSFVDFTCHAKSIDSHFQNSLSIPLPVLFDFENEVYYKRTVSIEDVCSACHSIDRRHRQRGILVRARMTQLHMRNGPIDVQKKTGQQRLPRHLNFDLPRQPDRGEENA
jgi:hypothetical protein